MQTHSKQLFAVASAVAMSLLTVTCPAQTWSQLGPAVPAAGRTMTPKIEMYNGGVPTITYQEPLSGGSVTTRVFNVGTNSWLPLGAPGGCSTGLAWWPHLAFSPAGQMYCASYDYGLNSTLSLREFNRSTNTWTPMGPSPLSLAQAHTPDVETHQGVVYVAYQDGPSGPLPNGGGALSVLAVNAISQAASYVGGVGFSNSLTSGSSVWSTNLEIAPNGELWVAYSESASGNSQAAVARYAGGAWQLVGGLGLGHGASGSNISMAMDSAGTPYVATLYYDYSTGTGIETLRVFKRNAAGTGWTQLGGSVGLTEGVAVSPEAGYREMYALAIDANNAPCVAYRGVNQGKQVCVRRFNATTGAWNAVGALGFSPGSGAGNEDDYISLTFRGTIPIVAFRHGFSDPNLGAASQLMVWAFF